MLGRKVCWTLPLLNSILMIKSKRITNPDSNKCRIANPPQLLQICHNEDVIQIIYNRNEQLIFDMRREIDPQSSPRGRAFELWKNATMPKVTITKTFNIGRLVKAGRRRGLMS